MKDLLAKLDELHAKAYGPRIPIAEDLDWDFTQGDFDSQLCARELWEQWPAVRTYIASLEELAGYADSMLDLAAERGVEYDIARECLDRALCEVGIR